MPILTYIDGEPLWSTPAEALAHAQAQGLVGFHTHTYNGQVGYMAGTTHGSAATPSSGFSQQETNVDPPSVGRSAEEGY